MNPKLLDVRRRKRICRASWRTYKKNKLLYTPEAKALKKRWLKLVRQHNRRRVFLQNNAVQRTSTSTHRSFKRDPFAYADKLFNGKKTKKSPTFTKAEADTFFQTTYSDGNRDYCYTPPPGLKRPPPPTTLFNTKPMKIRELKRLIRKKRNKATPGFNGISNLVFKKCESIIFIIHKIFVKIWKTRDIPPDWGLALIILLSKSDVLDKPDEFRPIALGSTCAKICFLRST